MITYGRAHCKNEECGASWDSITKLRKTRAGKGLGAKCPECQQGLTKREARTGGKKGKKS